jgi:hypothetical protein
MKLSTSIQPYSYKDESVMVGQIVDGKFVQEKSLRTVLKDSRLNVKRSYEGRYGKSDNTHNYMVEVPEQYPLAIAKATKTGHGTTGCWFEYEVLYSPVVEEKKVARKPRAKKVSPVVAALQVPEGKKARLVRGKLVIK